MGLFGTTVIVALGLAAACLPGAAAVPEGFNSSSAFSWLTDGMSTSTCVPIVVVAIQGVAILTLLADRRRVLPKARPASPADPVSAPPSPPEPVDADRPALGDGTDRANTRGLLASTAGSLDRILVGTATKGVSKASQLGASDLSEATQRNVAAMDADGDGAVSIEEVLAYVRRSMDIKKSYTKQKRIACFSAALSTGLIVALVVLAVAIVQLLRNYDKGDTSNGVKVFEMDGNVVGTRAVTTSLPLLAATAMDLDRLSQARPLALLGLGSALITAPPSPRILSPAALSRWPSPIYPHICYLCDR